MTTRTRAALTGALILAVGCACSPRGSEQRSTTRSAVTAVMPLELPDLSSVAPAVRDQLTDQFAALSALQRNPATSSATLAAAYGDAGKLLLAASYLDAAETAFANARAAAPGDARWPYYLGHVYRQRNQPDKAIEAFTKARHLGPDDLPTLVWLGEMLLDAGRPDEAVGPLTDALAREPRHPRALAALGRAAMARRDYPAAVERFEAALQADPKATAVHYQLSLAYRGAGNAAKADEHLARRGTTEPALRDPLMEAVSGILDSAVAYDARSRAALARGDWAAAIAEARGGLALVGDNPTLRATLHHRVGTAFAQTGDEAGARREFELAIAASNTFAPGHYSLGVMDASTGHLDAALRGFASAVTADPSYLPARLARADLLRQASRPAEALDEYDRVIAADSGSAAAQFGRAMALMSLERYPEARETLTRALDRHPGDRSLTLALARLLAGAATADVKDPARALALAEPIVRERATLDGVETVALALAGMGRFDEAAMLQADGVQQARSLQQPRVAAAMAERERLYRQHQTPRALWGTDLLYEP